LDELDQDWKRAKSNEARAASEGLLVNAAIEAGQPARTLPALLASERDFPNDYDPPARLSKIYGELRQYDKALAESDRALALAYGPIKVRMMQSRSKIYEKKGDRAAAKRVLEEAVNYARAVPKEQLPETNFKELEKQAASFK